MFILDWLINQVRLNDDSWDDDADEAFEEDDFEDNTRDIDYEPRRSSSARMGAAVRRSQKKGRRKGGAGREVCMMRPDDFNECQEAAGYLLADRVVILDLAKLGQGPAQRVIDFVSGTVYAVDGDFKQISQDIFIAAPASAELTGEFEDLVKMEAQDTSWRGGLRRLKTA